MKISKYVLSVLIGLMVSVSPGVADQEHPIYEGSQAFQKMKQLAGQWEGTVNFGEGTQTIKASYRVTSAGSVLV
jgi:hypothetical protein